MNSPDSYNDLVLDNAVLNELAVLKANLMASMSGMVDPPSRECADPDSDDLFNPTFNVVLQHLDELDAATAEHYRRKVTHTSRLPSSRNHPPLTPSTPTDSQATLCSDGIFPGSSSSPAKLLLLGSSSSGTKWCSIDRKLDQSTSNCEQRIGKRKARNLGDEEGTRGTQKGSSKCGRSQTTHSHSCCNRPLLQHTKVMPGVEIEDPVSNDPIDFLQS